MCRASAYVEGCSLNMLLSRQKRYCTTQVYQLLFVYINTSVRQRYFLTFSAHEFKGNTSCIIVWIFLKLFVPNVTSITYSGAISTGKEVFVWYQHGDVVICSLYVSYDGKLVR